MKTDLTNDILQALVAATAAQKEAALLALRGMAPEARPVIEPYDTLKGLSQKLNLHPTTLWRWGIPRHSLGGRPRFLLSEVRAYLESDDFKRKARFIREDRLARKSCAGVPNE